ncbi:MAG: flavocytochrome c [Treponema lecithinolyticum]|uniref:flavocytochrome c n=1 Tax=Treponema lecithinolyticum TaxID=53418 RepID=UPI0036226933
MKTTKKLVFLLLAAACVTTLLFAKGSDMKAGTYTETVKGMRDGLTVEVKLSKNKIESVTVKTHSETPGISDAAISAVPNAIVKQQSLTVDTVSGATMTSKGILAAVEKAISEAGGNPADFKNAQKMASAMKAKNYDSKPPKKWDETHDIIVVGGGFAGLAAAHSAKTNGAKDVVLIEKMPFVGGNSQINGGVYAAYTSKIAAQFQKEMNLPVDTAEKHIADTLKGGDYMGDEALVKNMVYGSPFYLNMLLDNGLEVRKSLTRPGGHYGYRTYTTINGQGSDIVQVQKKMVEKAGVPIMLNTKMVTIYREQPFSGKVVGIGVETKDGFKTMKASKGVILASGGFSADVPMRSRYVPMLTDELPTTNHVGATGESITQAQAIGAEILHMCYIQLYPFANPNGGVLDAWAVIPFSGPSSGVVYVDYKGERYVNEGERRDVCSNAAKNSGGFPTFCIMNEDIVKKGGFVTPAQLESGIKADRIFKADSLEDLAKEINKRTYDGKSVSMPGANLAATIKKHNGYVKNGSDPDFGKRIDKGIMMTIESGPYYAIPQWPSVHHTMGGLNITPKTEVRDIYGNVIPGLFAVGEVVGGIHGTNRLGSNAVADCCANGYIAGQYAATGTLPDFIKGK